MYLTSAWKQPWWQQNYIQEAKDSSTLWDWQMPSTYYSEFNNIRKSSNQYDSQFLPINESWINLKMFLSPRDNEHFTSNVSQVRWANWPV